MVGIKDFEMPESCYDCLLVCEKYEGGPLYCAITDECVDNYWNNKTKHEACSLVEIEAKED